MNVAFQALLIFALALPGLIFRTTYRRGFWHGPRFARPMGEEIAYSIGTACLLHAVYAPLASAVRPIDLPAVIHLLLAEFGENGQALSRAVQSLALHPYHILGYFAGIYVLAAGLGYGLHALVRAKQLDIRYPALRFENQWQYLLTGEITSFPETSSTETSDEVEAVLAACMVDVPGASLLYYGVLDAFYFDRSGELDLLVLRGAMRRKVEPSETDATAASLSGGYYFIDAEYIYLPYKQLRNVAIKFAYVEPAPRLAVGG